MKTLEAVGSNFYVAPAQKRLACRGSSNSELICFKLGRYIGETDLSECNCTIKTKNSEGKSDLAIPKMTTDDRKLSIYWMPSSGATSVAGPLQVQVQLEKIHEDDRSKNISWQSNIMDFKIADSLDAADEINDQNPTIFQQWEEKVNTLYTDAAADVQSMQALQTEVEADADAVAQQKQSVEQTAAQVTQDAQAAAESAQTAAASDTNAQTSVQDAQAQAETAQKAATQAQQKVDDFSGYTKDEIDNGFANALVNNTAGQILALNDMRPGSKFRLMSCTGQTVETNSGNKSPDNPHSLAGSNFFQISMKKNLFHPQPGTVTVNGVTCTIGDDETITLDGTASASTWITLTTALVGYCRTNSAPIMILTQGKKYIFSVKVISGSKSGTFYHTIRDVISTDIPGSCIMNESVSSQFVAGTPQTTNYSVSLYPGMLNLYAVSGAVFDHFQYRIQVEQSDSATAWEPCKDLQVISLPQSLYSLPNGVADSYDAVSGSGTQNIGKVVLDGTERWSFENRTDDYVSFQHGIAGIRHYDYMNNSEIIQSTHFKFGNNDLVYNAEMEGISVSSASDNLFLCILKSRLAGWDDGWTDRQKTSALQAWLAANPVTGLYQLADSQEITGTPWLPAVSAPAAVFSADTGSLQIKYQMDSNIVLTNVISAIRQLGGTY